MRVLIIEDEPSVAQNLCDILIEIDPSVKIMAVLETVKETVSWINRYEKPDLGFFDIKIADGNSFDIFEKTKVTFPVIFTTAFDEYALKAFKVNSVDYLLKPIKKSALNAALNKYYAVYTQPERIDYEHFIKAIQTLKQIKYKRSFLVHFKHKILPIATKNIAYFYLENDAVFCITYKKEKYLIDQTLAKIQEQVNPEEFFRANRQFIISKNAIISVSNYFQRKLKLKVQPNSHEDILISKLNVTKFKKWLMS